MSDHFITHHVRSGETLSGIARQYGVKLQDLLDANPEIRNPDRITLGQAINIPLSDDSPGAPTGGPEENVPAPISPTDPNALLHQYRPRGASNTTASQDGLPARGITGVQASHTMAETDRRRVMLHKDKIRDAARRFNLPPALLAAIASRESRGGSVLRNGFGDNGHGFGLMQVDDRNPFSVITTGGPFGQPHINQATGILRDKLEAVQHQFPDLSAVEQLETAVSRYNGGDGRPAPDSDQGTTGRDYMNDVWARALYYAREEAWGDSRAVTGAAAAPPTFDRQPEHFTPAPALEDVQEGRSVLQFGQEGDAVRHVQQLLDIHRDGEFGVNTRKAVIAFQRAHQMAISAGNEGNVDRATLDALEQVDKTDWAIALDKIDPREKTPRAHPELRRCLGVMAQALVRQGMQVMITDGLRTFAEQDALFAIGRRGRRDERTVTNARGGLSNHNYGMAVDLYPVIDDRVRTRVPENASQDFRNRFRAIQHAIGVEAERVGLTWGGRWVDPVDMPHVQLLAQDDLPPREALGIYRAHDNSMQAVWDEATRRFHRS